MALFVIDSLSRTISSYSANTFQAFFFFYYYFFFDPPNCPDSLISSCFNANKTHFSSTFVESPTCQLLFVKVSVVVCVVFITVFSSFIFLIENKVNKRKALYLHTTMKIYIFFLLCNTVYISLWGSLRICQTKKEEKKTS